MIVFSALVTVALVLMFPFQALVDRVLRDRRGDDLTVAYLHNLLRTDPNNASLALRLAQQQLTGGNLVALRATLAPLLAASDEKSRIAARLLLWSAEELEWKNAPEESMRRAALRRSLLAELEALSQLSLGETTQLEIAERALELGDQALALRLFRALGKSGHEFTADWFSKRAEVMLGQSHPDAAIELYRIARDRSHLVSEQRRYFVQAVKVRLAQNRPEAALTLADQDIGTLRDDVDTLVFMVQLARSANHPDTAARYARLMLKLALADVLRVAANRDVADENGVAKWRYAAFDENDTTQPKLLFDDRVYTLGYEAFVGNKDLDDAYRVAEYAIRQVPGNAIWRKRLAQVSEWVGKPQQALEQWQWLAEHNAGTKQEQEDAIQSILRLAPALFDDKALIVGLKHQLAKTPNDGRLLKALVNAFERLGEPESGIRVLEDFTARHPLEEPLIALADLAERAAHPDLAIKTLQHVASKFGWTRDRGLRLCALLTAQGKLPDAYAALKKASAFVPQDDLVFWRLLGTLAVRLQEENVATQAYGKIVALDNATVADFDSLIELLADSSPAQAGDLSFQAALRFDSWPHYSRALDLYATAKDSMRSAKAFASLPPQWKTRAENDAHFLSLRASSWREQGKRVLAMADYQRWLAISPDDGEAQESLLWILIDTHNTAALRAVLATHEEHWAKNARLHDALAAAWQTLSAPRVALDRYLTPRIKSHRDDFLWLMNYADALEQDQQTDLAWRYRQHLWRERRKLGSRDLPEDAAREARIRLALATNPGDTSWSELRALLRLDRQQKHSSGTVSDELILAWLLSHEETEAARGYLWARYASRLSQPQWATLALALANGDASAASELLDRRDAVPARYDAVSAAILLGDPALATTMAAESQTLQRDDEPLQLQLSELLLDNASRVEVQTEHRNFSKWMENESRQGFESQLFPSLRASVSLGEITRHPGQTLQNAPDERYADIALKHRQNGYETSMEYGSHRSFESREQWVLSQTLFASGAFNMSARLGNHEAASEALALRALGWRDSIGVESGYMLTPSDRLSFNMLAARYSTQNGVKLGKGSQVSLDIAHRLRLDGSDTNVALFWSSNHFEGRTLEQSSEVDRVANYITGEGTAAERVMSLMTKTYQIYGMRVSSGMEREKQYTRALHPYGSLTLSYNTDSGYGYAFSGGIATSLLGADHLSIGVNTEKGGTGSVARSTTLGAGYWLAF